ncbi:hypothetical protein PTKIN_Ptkin08bG0121500 [Pterospermum kingtungense]
MELDLMLFVFNMVINPIKSAGQESFEYLCDTTPEVIHPLSPSDLPIAIPVNGIILREVSSSVLKADSWLRLHVLAHFPAIKITTILVGDKTLLCQKDQQDNLGLLLPSLKKHLSLSYERKISECAVLSSRLFAPKLCSFW